MELIVPTPTELSRTVTGETVYIYPAWASGATYATNAVVRHLLNGVWEDWRANRNHTAAAANAPGSTTTVTGCDYEGWCHTTYDVSFWNRIGPAATESQASVTYGTNVKLSVNPSWAAGAVAEGATVYDPATHSDYRALIAMTAGENTARPSVAILSADETVRSRWLDLGSANAWAMFDHRINAYTTGIGSANNLLDFVTFTAKVQTATSVDRVAFAGLINVDVVWVRVFVGGVLSQEVSGHTIPSGVSHGVRHRSLSLAITPVTGSAITMEVTLQRQAPGRLNLLTNPQFAGVGGAATGWTWAPFVAGWAQEAPPISAGERYSGAGTLKILHPGPVPVDSYASVVQPNRRVTPNREYLVEAWVGNQYATAQIITQWFSAAGALIRADMVETAAQYPGGTELSGYHRLFSVMTPPPTAATAQLWFRTRLLPTDPTPAGGVASWWTMPYFGLDYADADSPGGAIGLGVMVVGRARELAYTEWNVETSIIPFSQKERNATFGTTTFVRRGSARQVSATCFIDTAKGASGDVVQQVLSDVDGRPIFWDFNNAGSNYDRLRVFGFYSNMRMAIPAFTFESLSLDVEGLVE